MKLNFGRQALRMTRRKMERRQWGAIRDDVMVGGDDGRSIQVLLKWMTEWLRGREEEGGRCGKGIVRSGDGGGEVGGRGAKCARGSAAAVSGEGPPSLPMCGAERYYSLGGPLETRPLRAPRRRPAF